ncbi:Gfo/Idh/MocA family protein [Acidithiobacillus sp. IBUN Pt1247-S3]|uniref:Gfo/Idh/MocA family protein n=1 Tax=Acidithiobacillus sp. IBUN Pt1247-S3 TaxID=3166642 RepID=UPI0034E479A7
MTALRTGVVGVGHLGRFHAQKYARISQLQGVYDANAERARSVAQELGCRAYDDLQELLTTVDAISIVTPTLHHHAVARAAIALGVHCLVEKPFTFTLAEADDLLSQAIANGVVLAVGQIERAQVVMQHLREQGFPAPRYIEAERLAPFKPRSLDVDVIMDLMIHDLDLVLMLGASPLQEVRAVGVAAVTDQADMANAWVTLANGSVANLAASRVVREAVRRMRIFWPDRYASVDFMQNRLTFYRRGSGQVPGIPGVQEEVVDLQPSDALEAEISAFLAAVAGQGRVLCSGEEGRAALAAALAVRQSVGAFLSESNYPHSSGA